MNCNLRTTKIYRSFFKEFQLTNTWMGEWMDRWYGRRKGKQAGRQPDRQTERQTEMGWKSMVSRRKKIKWIFNIPAFQLTFTTSSPSSWRRGRFGSPFRVLLPSIQLYYSLASRVYHFWLCRITSKEIIFLLTTNGR